MDGTTPEEAREGSGWRRDTRPDLAGGAHRARPQQGRAVGRSKLVLDTGAANMRRSGSREESVVQINRTEASRALAKVIAYRQCGKEAEAREWFARLARSLGYEPLEDLL